MLQDKYIIELKPVKKKIFPKKLLLNRKIQQSRYIPWDFQISLWIPDTPEDRREPLIMLSIHTPFGKLSLPVRSVIEGRMFLNEIDAFLSEYEVKITEVYNKALTEWNDFWEKITPFPNDKTVITVKQGEGGGILRKERV